MTRVPPVPETGMPGKSVHVGSLNLFLYCTVYDFPITVGKGRFNKPAVRVGAPMNIGTGLSETGPWQLAAAVTVFPWQVSMPLAVTVLVGVKVTTMLVV